MFDTKALALLISEATEVFRKGEVVDESQAGDIKVTTVWGFPHVNEAGSGYELVDCHFVVVGVNMEKAEQHKRELTEILAEYPDPERLVGGPSYIEIGAEIGSQELAFRLFALGKALSLWNVVIPESLGLEGDIADELAGKGMIFMTGWQVDA